jgi:hypothetical protein
VGTASARSQSASAISSTVAIGEKTAALLTSACRAPKGRPRIQGIQGSRALWIQGARPGDVMQIPSTLSTAPSKTIALQTLR